MDVTQDLVVTEEDCGTADGSLMRAIVEGGEVIESLRERILGRTAAEDLVNPETREVVVKAGQMLDEDAIDDLEAAGIDEVRVRTALTCATRFGVCAKCYGRDLGRGGLVNVGEAVGVITAQSIGEPGTQLTMRTFHIGGAASRAAVASSVEAHSSGVISFNEISYSLIPSQKLKYIIQCCTVYTVYVHFHDFSCSLTHSTCPYYIC